MNIYVGIILKLCWYNFYVSLANLFSDIFPICKVRWMETRSKRYLVYGWATKSASVKTKKQKNQRRAAR